MSDTLEIVEITDSSICIISPELESAAGEAFQNTTKTKRQLSRELSETDQDERSAKKICADIEDKVVAELIENESVIDATIFNESKTHEESENEFSQPDILEQNISLEKSIETVVEADDDLMLEEEPLKTLELENDGDDVEEQEEEEIGEESFEYHEDSEHSSIDSDDDEMMARVSQASGKRPQLPPKTFHVNDDEPIALDDSDDEPPHETSKYESDNEHSSEFSIDNQVIGDSGESDEDLEDSPVHPKPTKPHLLLTRKLVKKSIRFLTRKRLVVIRKGTEVQPIVPTEVKKDSEKPKVDEKLKQTETAMTEPNLVITEEKLNHLDIELMDVSDVVVEPPLELPTEKIPPLTEPAKNQSPMEVTQTENSDKNQLKSVVEKNSTQEPAKSDEQANIVEPIEPVNDKSSAENSNESSHHESSLLTEISNSTKDEIFNRYVLKNTEQSPTLDEFSEELFYCLQMNNQEIEKARNLWNEKLHVKYKIRELMDTIRRHRAVMDIETFGFKPEAAGTNSHPVNSSKSSTTTNSETDLYDKHFRMSSESVSRLIQDVRATMLKRDDKQRGEDLGAGSNAGENSLASQWNNLQANSAQGRQGQIIDVQSIINDFRQKNPQEIPRRGRRMKSSFGGGFYEGQQENTNEFTNSTMKSNQSGYPEVSLHPVSVHNMYKNLVNSSVASGSGVNPFASVQKSSLLQSILTKQSTKSPVGFHQNHSLPSTSTLARLLTAPERSFQGAPKHVSQPPPRQSSTKVHNNGEITITPIGLNNRSKDFSMEDDENSMEPPLVIDETEDFDASERSNLKSSVSDLLCQGCKKNKAFFMCAGCSRQWYCSKECQELAWDLHAESCMI